MGLFLKYQVVQFLDGCSEKLVADAATSLLSMFFEIEASPAVLYHSSAGMPPSEAATLLAAKLVSLPPIASGGTGLTFQLETPSMNKWHLFLSRDVFPRIELRAFDGEASKLDRHKARRLVDSGVAHLFHSSSRYGCPGDVYLSLKLYGLRQRGVHALAPEGDLSSAVRFRQLCNDVLNKPRGSEIAPQWFSWWSWQVNRFARSCDDLLLKSAGTRELGTMLSRMGLSLALWFPGVHEDLSL